MPTRTQTKPADDRATSPRLRVREAFVAAFALACFAGATPGKAAVAPAVLAQAQPGEPTADVPLAEPARPVAVEIAMRMEEGALVCRPELARLPTNEELTLQLVNATDAPAAFAAPELFASGSVASTVEVAYDHDAAAFVVPAGTTGQIVFSTGGEGAYAFACAPAGEEATARGELVVED